MLVRIHWRHLSISVRTQLAPQLLEADASSQKHKHQFSVEMIYICGSAGY